MQEILIRQISIISVSILNLAITCWYCWLTYKQKIKPALAMWIFFTIAVGISLTTYLKADHFSLWDNILNTTDLDGYVACANPVTIIEQGIAGNHLFSSGNCVYRSTDDTDAPC